MIRAWEVFRAWAADTSAEVLAKLPWLAALFAAAAARWNRRARKEMSSLTPRPAAHEEVVEFHVRAVRNGSDGSMSIEDRLILFEQGTSVFTVIERRTEQGSSPVGYAMFTPVNQTGVEGQFRGRTGLRHGDVAEAGSVPAGVYLNVVEGAAGFQRYVERIVLRQVLELLAARCATSGAFVFGRATTAAYLRGLRRYWFRDVLTKGRPHFGSTCFSNISWKHGEPLVMGRSIINAGLLRRIVGAVSLLLERRQFRVRRARRRRMESRR